MKEKQKINHVYFMYISLPSHYAEAKIKGLKPAVCYTILLVKKVYLAYSAMKLQ